MRRHRLKDSSMSQQENLGRKQGDGNGDEAPHKKCDCLSLQGHVLFLSQNVVLISSVTHRKCEMFRLEICTSMRFVDTDLAEVYTIYM